ncbi:MAG: hypothetical protein ACK4Z7_09605 [Novosphingobium sp.]
MESTILSQIITSFGPSGAFVGYLIWQQMRRDKIDGERVETDKELATALANLTNAINASTGASGEGKGR